MRRAASARRAGDSTRRSSARERILAAAFAAFTERGYAAARTLDIATRAKVSKRELYALFGNKQQMLITCIAERARRMHPPADRSAPRDAGELEATLVRFGSVLLTEVCDPDVVALQRLAIAEADRSPEVRESLELYGRQACLAALAEVFAAARPAALAAADDVETLAGRFLSLLLGDLPMSLALGLRQPPDPEEIARRSRDAALAVLRRGVVR